MGDFVHDQPNNNGPNFKLKNMYGNTRINLMRKHVTLKFTPTHMNSVFVETWESFKPTPASTTQDYLKRTHLPPLSPPDQYTNHQDFLAATQKSKGRKTDEIELISKSSIAPKRYGRNQDDRPNGRTEGEGKDAIIPQPPAQGSCIR